MKELREKTGAGMMDCKKALTESGGDTAKAEEWLRQKGLSAAAKKAGRVASEGAVGSYVHLGGKIGVLVEINCETDFVARNEVFQQFVKDVAMHIAASAPLFLKREDVPSDVVEKEKAIYRAQLREQGKPEKVWEKILEGKLDKFYKDVCLVDQAFVKDPGQEHPAAHRPTWSRRSARTSRSAASRASSSARARPPRSSASRSP